MNTIINKNTKSFNEFEKNIFDIICLIGESLTSYILEKWNDEINENRDKSDPYDDEVIYQLDRFLIQQEIIRQIKDKEARTEIRRRLDKGK